MISKIQKARARRRAERASLVFGWLEGEARDLILHAGANAADVTASSLQRARARLVRDRLTEMLAELAD